MANGLTQEFVSVILSRLDSVCRPRLVILFGSFARDTANEGSDVDLLVVLPRAENPRDEAMRIRDSLRGLGKSFDVIVMSEERFEETKEVIGGIAYPAHKYGQVLYEAA